MHSPTSPTPVLTTLLSTIHMGALLPLLQRNAMPLTKRTRSTGSTRVAVVEEDTGMAAIVAEVATTTTDAITTMPNPIKIPPSTKMTRHLLERRRSARRTHLA